jgi:hypothetical protein
MTTSGQPTCKQTKADGTPCRAAAHPDGDGNCIFHSLRHAEKRTEARRQGGRKRMRPAAVVRDAEDLPMSTVADVTAVLGKAINETRQGKLDPRVSNAIGYLASVLLRAFESDGLARELAELKAMKGADHVAGTLTVEQRRTRLLDIIAALGQRNGAGGSGGSANGSADG